MKEEDPRGFICLAVFRPQPALFSDQIRSIQSQSLRDWVCIVGIDGRDPAAAALAIELIGDDTRFQLVEFEDNVGFYRNFERLLNLVPQNSPWVALADQDDKWYVDKLEQLTRALTRCGGGVVAGRARIVMNGETSGTTSRRASSLAGLMLDNQLTGTLAVLNGRVLDRALPFPNATDVAYHDHWLAVVGMLDGGVHQIDLTVQDYVQHSANVIGEHQRPLTERLRNTIAGGKNHSGSVSYIADHRWRWRVNMAQLLLARFPATDDKDLRSFAHGGLSAHLAYVMFLSVVRREAPLLRVLALAAGALTHSVRSRSGRS